MDSGELGVPRAKQMFTLAARNPNQQVVLSKFGLPAPPGRSRSSSPVSSFGLALPRPPPQSSPSCPRSVSETTEGFSASKEVVVGRTSMKSNETDSFSLEEPGSSPYDFNTLVDPMWTSLSSMTDTEIKARQQLTQQMWNVLYSSKKEERPMTPPIEPPAHNVPLVSIEVESPTFPPLTPLSAYEEEAPLVTLPVETDKKRRKRKRNKRRRLSEEREIKYSVPRLYAEEYEKPRSVSPNVGFVMPSKRPCSPSVSPAPYTEATNGLMCSLSRPTLSATPYEGETVTVHHNVEMGVVSFARSSHQETTVDDLPSRPTLLVTEAQTLVIDCSMCFRSSSVLPPALVAEDSQEAVALHAVVEEEAVELTSPGLDVFCEPLVSLHVEYSVLPALTAWDSESPKDPIDHPSRCPLSEEAYTTMEFTDANANSHYQDEEKSPSFTESREEEVHRVVTERLERGRFTWVMHAEETLQHEHHADDTLLGHPRHQKSASPSLGGFDLPSHSFSRVDPLFEEGSLSQQLLQGESSTLAVKEPSCSPVPRPPSLGVTPRQLQRRTDDEYLCQEAPKETFRPIPTNAFASSTKEKSTPRPPSTTTTTAVGAKRAPTVVTARPKARSSHLSYLRKKKAEGTTSTEFALPRQSVLLRKSPFSTTVDVNVTNNARTHPKMQQQHRPGIKGRKADGSGKRDTAVSGTSSGVKQSSGLMKKKRPH